MRWTLQKGGGWWLAWWLLGGASGCQSYAFETRLPASAVGHSLVQNVQTLTPTDILFVIDDSGSMLAKRTELARNMGLFFDALAGSHFDYQVGIVTTDVECNVPERSCPGDGPASSSTSLSCCDLVTAAQIPLCADYDLNSDGHIDWTSCNGGRLRAPRGATAYWTPPTAKASSAWISSLSQTILNLGCEGSGLEAGLEAARRAVNCAVFGYDPKQPQICPSAAMAQLNQGFIRADADLVVVFVSDEDDCSFVTQTPYERPSEPNNTLQQASHLCSPAECYAGYGSVNHQTGLLDWVETTQANGPLLTCADANTPGLSYPRSVNPPSPTAVQTFIDQLVAAKGGNIQRVRAAGIISGVASSQRLLGLEPSACTGSALGPSANCGCWSANLALNPLQNFYCNLTAHLQQASVPTPPQEQASECSQLGSGSNEPLPGCTSMPSARYVEFFEQLASQRQQALLQADVLTAPICANDYSSSISDLVNNVVLDHCFALQQVPSQVSDIVVQRNGVLLPHVPVGGPGVGWSWQQNAPEICLEGGLTKTIGDTYTLFVLDSQTQLSIEVSKAMP